MLASRNSHEDDLLAVGGEIAIDCVVDLPALAEASEPLRSEVVDVEAAVPGVVIRIAVEEDPALHFQSGVGRIRGFFASAAPGAGGWGLDSEQYGTHTPKHCCRHRSSRPASAEIFRSTRVAGRLLCACGYRHCDQENGLDRGTAELDRGVHGTCLEFRPPIGNIRPEPAVHFRRYILHSAGAVSTGDQPDCNRFTQPGLADRPAQRRLAGRCVYKVGRVIAG